jgi:hypothetical protein
VPIEKIRRILPQYAPNSPTPVRLSLEQPGGFVEHRQWRSDIGVVKIKPTESATTVAIKFEHVEDVIPKRLPSRPRIDSAAR